MAKLTVTPYPWPETDHSNRESIAAESALLKALYDISDKLLPGQIVGAMLRFPVADGYAHYLVVRERPLTLQDVPYGDAYQISAAHIRGIRKTDVLEQLEQRRRWAAVMRRKEE